MVPASGPPAASGSAAPLFLVVTAFWLLVFSTPESDWELRHEDILGGIALVLSAVSVVMTGFVGRRVEDALFLGWIPGAAMMALGLLWPARDALIFVGGLVLFGWAVYFFPLIALGVALRERRQAQAGRAKALANGAPPHTGPTAL
jgi:hypothetical protein